MSFPTYISVGQNKICYQSSGNSRRKALFFIHGGGVDHQMWGPQRNHFSPNYHIITYDIRGHGQSTFVDNELTDAEDILAVINDLGLEKVDLIGLSLGAVLALDFCLAHPERVERLVLLSPGLVGVQEKEPTYLEPIMGLGEAIWAKDFDRAVAIIHDWTFQGQFQKKIAVPEALAMYLAHSFRRYLESGNHVRLPHLHYPTPVDHLSKIHCPTLVLYGQMDLPYMKKNAETLAAGIPECEVQVLPKATHLINIQESAQVNRAIEWFFRYD